MRNKTSILGISPDQRLGIRRSAFAPWQRGARAPSIAAALGLNRSTVRNWTAAFAAHPGDEPRPEAKRGPKPGHAPSGLTPAQEAKAVRLITDMTPEQMKFDFALWSREAVRELLLRRFGADPGGRTVRRHLKKLGFTLQHPGRRARERDEAAARRRLEEDYPRVKRAAKRAKAVVTRGDEAVVKASEQRPRGYSPKGKTPVCATVANRGCKAELISAVSNTGMTRFMILKTAPNAAPFITFLERLVRDMDRPVFLIVDNLRVHHSKALKPWLKKNRKRLRLFYLPSCSPDLNPDEHLNNDLKQAVNRRAGARTSSRLAATVSAHLHRRAKQPAVVKSIFKQPKVRYAA